MTGLVAGAFVLSSLYHVFGIKQLKDIARFALVFSFALLPGALLPLLLHLQHPLQGHQRAHDAALHLGDRGLRHRLLDLLRDRRVGALVHLPASTSSSSRCCLREKPHKTLRERAPHVIYTILTLGSFDISEKAQRTDAKATKILAAAGIPVALFLHGYAGFIFGSVKANALWMTPLMPVIFIVSAIVSGIAFCLLTYIVTMEIRKLLRAQEGRARRSPRRTPRGDRAASRSASSGSTSKYLAALSRPRDQPGAARHGLSRLHGGQVVGRGEERRLRQRVQAGLRPAVRDRQPRAADPVPDSRA